VVDRNSFRPFQTAVEIIKRIRAIYGEEFQWKQPPYEYEREKLPIEILLGRAMPPRPCNSPPQNITPSGGALAKNYKPCLPRSVVPCNGIASRPFGRSRKTILPLGSIELVASARCC